MIVLRRNSFRVCLFALAAAALTGRVAHAQANAALLDSIPADAWGYLVIPSLEKLDAKASMLSAKVGMPIPPPVTSAAASFGLTEGLDVKSGLAVVVLDFKKYGQEGVAMLIPSSDARKMVAGLPSAEADDKAAGDDEGEEDEEDEGEKSAGDEPKPAKEKASIGDLKRCRLVGMPVFAGTKGSFVVIGRSAEACHAVIKNKKSLASIISKERKAAIDRSDLILSLGIGTITKAYADQIAALVEMFSAMSGPESAQVKSGIDDLIKMAREMDALDIGLAIQDYGVSISAIAVPQSGSELAETLKSPAPKSGSYLRLLPKEKFLFAMGAGGNENVKEEDWLKAAKGIASMPGAKESVDEKKLNELAKDLAAWQKSVSSAAIAICVLPEGPDGILGAAIVMESSDAAGMLKTIGKLVEKGKALSTDEEFKKAAAIVEHKSGAESIGDVSVDHLTFNLKKLGDDIDEEDLESVDKVLGKEGLTVRIGAADKSHVVMSLGGGKGRFEKLLNAAQKGQDGLDEDGGIVRVSKRLPAQKTGEFYVAVDSILGAVGRVMTALGEEEEMPFKLADVNAPIAASTTVEGDAGRFDLFVPMELINAVKDAYMASMAGDEEMEEDEEMEADEKAGDKEEASDEEKSEKGDDSDDDGGE
ncbi:MAG: hypothetical protein L6Q92_02900 [Phycisphaerae bacterium]|nr:hypothetical protein [Phycisphaerae bacterium]